MHILKIDGKLNRVKKVLVSWVIGKWFKNYCKKISIIGDLFHWKFFSLARKQLRTITCDKELRSNILSPVLGHGLPTRQVSSKPVRLLRRENTTDREYNRKGYWNNKSNILMLFLLFQYPFVNLNCRQLSLR